MSTTRNDEHKVDSVLGESEMIHDNKELSTEQWNINIAIMVEKLNRQNRGVWQTTKTEYGRRLLVMTVGDDQVTLKINAWGRHVVNEVEMYPAITIGTAKEYSDVAIKRIFSKNTNVMINNETIKLILDNVNERMNIELWRKIDCDKQRSKRHMANFKNWEVALSKIAVPNPQEINSLILKGIVLLKETLPEGLRSSDAMSKVTEVIRLNQVRKGEFAKFDKFSISGDELITQISIDGVHGSISADSETTSNDEMKRKMIAIIDSGISLESFHVTVDGSVDEIASLTKKLADGKEIVVE